MHAFIHSVNHSPNHFCPVTSVRSRSFHRIPCTHAYMYSFKHSVSNSSLRKSFIHSFVHSFMRAGTHACMHARIQSFKHSITPLLLTHDLGESADYKQKVHLESGFLHPSQYITSLKSGIASYHNFQNKK